LRRVHASTHDLDACFVLLLLLLSLRPHPPARFLGACVEDVFYYLAVIPVFAISFRFIFLFVRSCFRVLSLRPRARGMSSSVGERRVGGFGCSCPSCPAFGYISPCRLAGLGSRPGMLCWSVVVSVLPRGREVAGAVRIIMAARIRVA
jgi:hypothetical protein